MITDDHPADMYDLPDDPVTTQPIDIKTVQSATSHLNEKSIEEILFINQSLIDEEHCSKIKATSCHF
jgi:hypothetical protein